MTAASADDLIHSNCWAEINLAALAHNARALASLGPAVMAVLKADAYGHGVEIVAPELAKIGIAHYGVATAAEGAALRRLVGDRAAIYVMTGSVPVDAHLIARHRLTPFVSTNAALKYLGNAAASQGISVAVHLEIDTGIGRAGIAPEEMLRFIETARATNGIELTGICTHFTSGEDGADAARQYALFKGCIASIPDAVRRTLAVHASNSPTVLNGQGTDLAMVRPGLLLYGIAPLAGHAPVLPSGAALRPVLALKARVILARRLRAGTPLSYGRTYRLPADATIATVGIGYGDGYSRRFSNVGHVILPSGVLAPVRGRVCMDQTCVEIPSGEDVREGDVVTLIGACGDAHLRAADLANEIDATPHEITTCITQRVPRVALRA